MKKKSQPHKRYRWQRTSKTIRCLSQRATIFEDTVDHWNNAILRLLHLTDTTAQQWIECSDAVAIKKYGQSFAALRLDHQVETLQESWATLYPEAVVKQHKNLILKARPGRCGHPADHIVANAVDSDAHFTVVGCTLCEYGWLVNTRNPDVPLGDTVSYEQEYFEGGTNGLGYGHYLQQEGWRLEKSYRQVRQITSAAQFFGIDLNSRTRLLDVGSGYGFLRKAADDAGWQHDGIEASRFATEACKKQYGFDTFVGDLHDFVTAKPRNRYDIIVLADVLEHVKDPIAELQAIKKMLNPKGFCLVRTPSAVSIEAQIFGNLFYSLKREHLNYFSPRAVSLFAHAAGLSPRLVVTQSHFLQGLFGEGTRVHESTLRGSDIFAIIQNI